MKFGEVIDVLSNEASTFLLDVWEDVEGYVGGCSWISIELCEQISLFSSFPKVFNGPHLIW